MLLHLEIGNAVAKQSADAVRSSLNGHTVAGARNCCAAASPAGPEPITATRLPVRDLRRLGLDPALVEGMLDDGLLDLLDRDRRLD